MSKPRNIDELSGPWADGIDAKQADLHLEGQLGDTVLSTTWTKDDPASEGRNSC